MAHRIVQTASHWGVYDVELDESGAIVGTRPTALDPHPSPIASALPDTVRSKLRVDRPYVRSGYLRDRNEKVHNRGGEPFVAVSWDRALDLVADELKRVKAQHGNGAIYGGSRGWASAGRLHHAPSAVQRFLNMHGGYADRLGNHSFGAALGIMPYVLGRGDIVNLIVPWTQVIAEARLVVMFGGAHLKNMQIESGGLVMHETQDWFRKAAAANIEFVNISPSRQDLAPPLKSEWWPIRPNTDVALMLALAHTLASEDLLNREFLARYCKGYPRFERYLLGADDGQPKDADWAARIAGVDAEKVRTLARRMASTRTLIATSWSVQRADHGEQPVWMTVTLAAMLGQIGLPGRGFCLGFGGASNMATPRVRHIPMPTLPLGANPVTTHVPTGRVTDMLLNPGEEIDYDGRKLRFPEIKLVYAAGGNPFHHNTNLNRFVEGWQRPDTVIVHEMFWNPGARHADIVLPATTTMERNDIQAAHLSRFYVAMHKVMEPVGHARNDMDICADLADRLGFREAYTEGRDEMGWLRHMYEKARGQAQQRGFNPPDFDEFWRVGRYEFPLPSEETILLGDFRADPAVNKLKTPSGLIEIFSAKIESFAYDDCPPHPSWLEPAEWLGSSKAKQYPLHLLSNQPSTRLHSQLDLSPLSRAAKIKDREPLYISERDAAARGLKAGDVVRVFNDRGAFLAGVAIAEHLLPGVVQVATGAWFDPAEGGKPGSLDKHGNPNVVTMDKATSKLAQASAAQTALVQVEKYDGDLPPVTAFTQPEFEKAEA